LRACMNSTRGQGPTSGRSVRMASEWLPIAGCLMAALSMSIASGNAPASSPGDTTYLVDPAKGDDANPAGMPWKTFGKLNSIRLAPGDKVVIVPGLQEESLKPMGGGTAEKPVVIRFLSGIHTIGIRNVTRVPMFVSNSMDSDEPKPVGILIDGFRHLRLQGGGVDGDGKTTILYDGRMVEIYNHHAEDVTFTGLVFDLKRPTVSEFRVLETGPAHAVIQIAEGSDYAVENGRFRWRGDWGPGAFCQKFDLKERRCRRFRTPRGWDAQGQSQASARDLGGRKVRLDYPNGESGLEPGHQYHFRNTKRDSVGVHNARCKDIVFRDCDFYALTGMGFVSQFTENITYQRVNVAPPRDTIRTCPAWADIFQFSNCRGDVLVDTCRLSGMQDDAINCHGTYLRIVEKTGDNRLLVRFMHPQTYGFAAFVPGDEVAVICHSKLREYAGNPHRKVTAIERKSDRDWLLTLDGTSPHFGDNDVIDNITWHPNITVRNNHVSVDPVRGILLTTPGKAVIENNTFQRCALAAVSMSADSTKWFESAPVRDVLICGNTFIECGVCVDPAIESVKQEEPIHQNIRIIDNHFDGAGVNATGARKLTITGNRSAVGPLPIRIDRSCTEVKIGSNMEKW
ncbi:MAG: right-handed parallel beta-helix repeat-containing protein, partial [Verrucomicrobiota bacterium]